MKKNEIYSRKHWPYKPIKIDTVNKKDGTVIITPVGDAEGESFHRMGIEKFKKEYFQIPYIDCIISDEKKVCIICKNLTDKIEINYGAFICSEKCLKKIDKKFFKALRGEL